MFSPPRLYACARPRSLTPAQRLCQGAQPARAQSPQLGGARERGRGEARARCMCVECSGMRPTQRNRNRRRPKGWTQRSGGGAHQLVHVHLAHERRAGVQQRLRAAAEQRVSDGANKRLNDIG